MSQVPDAIERTVEIMAPIEVVFSAITDPAQFSSWFCEGVEGELEPGQRPVLDFGEPGRFRVEIVGKESPHFFAMRGPVLGLDGVDYTSHEALAQPGTLVEFHLTAVEGGTQVLVRESGFQSLPDSIAKANYDGNTEGWEYQMPRLQRFVETGSPS